MIEWLNVTGYGLRQELEAYWHPKVYSSGSKIVRDGKPVWNIVQIVHCPDPDVRNSVIDIQKVKDFCPDPDCFQVPENTIH